MPFAFLASPLIRYGLIALAFILLGVWGYAEHAGRVSAEKGEKAAVHEMGIWKASYEGAASALKDVRGKLDAENARAEKQQEIADQKVTQLAQERDAALLKAQSFKAELERKANEPGATAASVGRAALDGLR